MKIKDFKLKHIFMLWPAYFIIAILIDMASEAQDGEPTAILLASYWIMISMFYVSLFIANFNAYKKDKSKLNLVFVVVAGVLLANYMIQLVFALFR